ncbi:DEAD box protein box polypeptide 27 [Aphelenchoides avenae]|nr:DEAD box protein box polypeptide 27 [Aphelenchus avenae]KAH7728521.1 DEAD box protein box polypeptide 27 [Aphelenchus avenae]
MLYPKTIDDDETVPAESSSDEEDEGVEVKRKRRKKPVGSTEFSEDFTFGESELQDVEDHLDGLRRFLKKAVPSTLQEKIEKERKKARTSADKDGEEGQQNGIANGNVSDESDDDNDIVQALPESTDRVRDKQVKQKKKGSKAEKEAFFDPASRDILDSTGELSFHDLNLSRPLLKASTISLIRLSTRQHYGKTTSACIPVALAGKDVCACSATGTGKTAAFMLPILERLLYRPKQKSVTRVLVLVPTRELAIQVFQVSRKLAQFCNNVEICLCAGECPQDTYLRLY